MVSKSLKQGIQNKPHKNTAAAGSQTGLALAPST